jgi:rhomboid protease GluP
MGTSPQGPEPEILPPDGETGQTREKPIPLWKGAPATYLLVAINCLVFLYMIGNGVSFWMPTPDQLAHFGGTSAFDVLSKGEWIRIVTAMFVHVGIIHLATNMWCLWNLGLLAEPLLGSFGLLSAYILTGAAGNLLSTLWGATLGDPYSPGAGASGAVFGLAGVLIVLLKSPLLPLPKFELSRLRRSVIYFAGINFLIGMGSFFAGSALHVRIDNSAHVGGFCGGLLFATPLVPRIGAIKQQFIFRRRAAVALMVIFLVLFGFFVSHFPVPPLDAPVE